MKDTTQEKKYLSLINLIITNELCEKILKILKICINFSSKNKKS